MNRFLCHFLMLLAVLCLFGKSVQAEDDPSAQPPAAQKNGVLFVGSSSIHRWKTLTDDFPGINVINRGVDGYTIPDCTRDAERVYAPLQPRLIIFYAGDNDLAWMRSPEQLRDDYQAFVKRMRELLPDVPIGFISIKPSPSRAYLLDKMKATNELIKDSIAQDKSQFYIDVFTPMLAADGKARPELFGPDKLHMNADGYRLWQSIVAPHLK